MRKINIYNTLGLFSIILCLLSYRFNLLHDFWEGFFTSLGTTFLIAGFIMPNLPFIKHKA